MTAANVLRLLGVSLLVCAAGCAGRPNAANIELRKENQKLVQQLAMAQKQHQADVAQLSAIRSSGPTIPTLPPDRLARLDTVTGISFGRLTGGYSDAGGADQGVRVYFVPVDASGQSLKATGQAVVDVFDLGAGGKEQIRVAHGAFDLDALRKQWRGEFLMDYYYVISIPWETAPAHANLTVRVQFIDELTQLPFVEQKQITVKPPVNGATPPASQPGRSHVPLVPSPGTPGEG